MRLNTISKLCCPFDKKDLDLQIISQDTNNNIIEGLLTCTECKRYYPIVKGIPIMNPDEYREAKFELPLMASWKQLNGKRTDNFRLASNGESKVL
ncbi:MAG TPA: Trm112 family protein [Cyclobacteriaceae bacterium]|jgi:uncharacterized protein YbaR (Trm112 family)|nr:Trm112 family protein [Cyclobacteriaceae bacterium]